MTFSGIVSASIILLFVLVHGQTIVNPVSEPVRNGRRPFNTRFFAQIPQYEGRPSKIVGIISQGDDLYITTSSSGGLIYRVTSNGTVSLWFNAAMAMERYGRKMNVENPQHGGIRGLAFHPRFLKNGYFYISAMEDRPADPSEHRYFTTSESPISADSVVIEFKYSFSRNQVLQRTLRTVLRVAMQKYDHPVKQITFQGFNLLIAHGDGSVQSAFAGGGQGNDALGKILRINPRPSGSMPYRIPADNPFIGDPRWRDELYAVGFRNPHNICYSKRHGIFVIDAGRDNVEEVNIIQPGGNYGWSEREGTFVHIKEKRGILDGIEELPANDSAYGFIYPNVQVGHFGERGDQFVGQALAGGCPVETQSTLRSTFIYANFPGDGQVYYSWLLDMNRAVTTGPPSSLTQAKVYKAKVFYDHDGRPETPPLALDNLRDVVRADGWINAGRVDVRFGRGKGGELYWSSKTNGRIYVVTSTIEGQ